MKKFKHITIEIEQDDSAGNPRNEFDHISTFYGPKQGRYLIGGKKDVELYEWELSATIKEFKKEGSVVVEFESNAGTCYAVVERRQMQKEYLDYGYSMRKALYHARQCAKGEINEWLAFCNGEVYGYIIKDEDGETLDSCWGYYGRQYAEEEAQSVAEHWENEKEKEEQHMNERLAHACGLPA